MTLFPQVNRRQHISSMPPALKRTVIEPSSFSSVDWTGLVVDLADLLGLLGETPVGEQRVGFVEDEEGAGVARLGERGGDLLLRLLDPHRHQVGRPLLRDFQTEALGKVADVGALARSGRSLQTQRETPFAEACEPLREGGRVRIGIDESGVETGRCPLRRLRARQEPGQAAPRFGLEPGSSAGAARGRTSCGAEGRG